MRHANIPIFIPHEGCPHDCVFCRQQTITGVNERADRDIVPEIEQALSTIEEGVTDIEIAFFGGSFTGIERNTMIRLLASAQTYLKSGRVSSVRLSTRPDYIDDEILSVLCDYGVKHIELGVQSMDDEVLRKSGRGHTAFQTEKACEAIVKRGFVLGGQMMIGLPGSNPEKERETAEKIVSMGCLEARIYPTVVFEQTALCRMAKSGEYTPLSVEQAVERSADAYEIFLDGGVKVLRVGLQETEMMGNSSEIYGGAHHPALGELTEGEVIFRRLSQRIGEITQACERNGGVVTVYCAPGEASKVAGQNKRNTGRLIALAKEKGTAVKRIRIVERSGEKPFLPTVG